MIVLLRSLSLRRWQQKAALVGRLRVPSKSGVAGEPVVGPSGTEGYYKRRANCDNVKNVDKSSG
jgi:hypothetical protein